MNEKLSKFKRSFFSALIGGFVVLTVQLIAALLIRGEVLSEGYIKPSAFAAVFIGSLVSSLISGGKIYGIVSSVCLLGILFLEGLLLFPGRVNVTDVLSVAASVAAAAAAGTLLSGLTGKK